MTSHWREPVVCECGHGGFVCWSENDQPFSKQWEKYRIDGFDGEGFYIEGSVTIAEAIKRMKPTCPVCGAVGKVAEATKPQ